MEKNMVSLFAKSVFSHSQRMTPVTYCPTHDRCQPPPNQGNLRQLYKLIKITLVLSHCASSYCHWVIYENLTDFGKRFSIWEEICIFISHCHLRVLTGRGKRCSIWAEISSTSWLCNVYQISFHTKSGPSSLVCYILHYD